MDKRKADAPGNAGPADRSSSQPKSAGKKLKVANSCGVKDPTADQEPGPLHFPAPVWGRVLDYMPYDEVRSSLLVGKIIANEAVQYVHTLSFMKSCQLDVPSARRFPNVERVNILCLVGSSRSPLTLIGPNNFTICEATSNRVVPLLSVFVKLKSSFLGGVFRCSWEKHKHAVRPYYHDDESRDEFDEGMMENDKFKCLLKALLGALQARLLSPTLEKLGGLTSAILLSPSSFCEGRDEGRDACAFCCNLLSNSSCTPPSDLPLHE